MKAIKRLLVVIVSAITFTSAAAFASSPDEKKVVVVTGASQGIGFATARHLAEEGYIVYATVRASSNTKDLDAVSDLNKENLFKVVMPLTDEDEIGRVFDSIVLKHGHIDVLINNAAYVLSGTVDSCTVNEQMDQFDVNYFGPVRTIRAALPYMKMKQSGKIINIGSVSGMAPYSPWENYSASKFALRGLSESMAAWLSPQNIQVCVVEPATIKTRGSEEGSDPKELAKFLQGIIESPKLHVRYQFGAFAEDLAGKVYADPSGNEVRNFNIDYYQNSGLLPK